MKTLFFAITLFASSLVFAQVSTPADLVKVNKNCQNLPTPASIEGKWYVGNMTDPNSGMTFHMSFVISKTSTTSVLMCQGPGWNLSANVTTPSLYTPSTFAITGSGFDQTTQGGSNCQLNVQPANLKYSFSGGCLVMQDSMTGETQTLSPINP